jgi:type IV pilus assembly protein PilY1
MKRLLSLLALVLLADPVSAGTTSIAQLPLLNITGTGAVKPNLMLLYDNSGSMGWTFTPDYIDDSTTCRSRAQMAGGTRSCAVGHPPFNSPDFNKQYYNPLVLYSPPIKADGTYYPSQNQANTTSWTSVTTDGFGMNDTNMLGATASTSNLVTGFPDLKWCDTNSANCAFNSATYLYPNDVLYTSASFTANPYYYSIAVGEYCTDASLTTCKAVGAGGTAPAGYAFPAKVRWCNSTALTDTIPPATPGCQAKYVGTYKYPRYSSPNSGQVAAYGTIAIRNSASASALTITSVSVHEPGATVVITNGSISAPNGTDTIAKQVTVATSVAASIIAKTGLANQYTACVRNPSPSGTVPSCSSFGITLTADNLVAVIPITCPAGTSGKGVGPCSVLNDASRNGWAVTVISPSNQVTPAEFSTALLTFAGATKNKSFATLDSLKLGTSELITGGAITFPKSADSAAVAAAIVTKIGTGGTIAAYIGGSSQSPACTAANSPNTVCLINTSSSAAANLAITVGNWTNIGSLTWTSANSTAYVKPGSDTILTDDGVLGTGSSVFVRTDIVSTRNSYPKGSGRSDCAGTTCTYNEEMTNFANWYGYYKTRNQMMKTAVGQAFAPMQDNYRVGLVSLSVAAAQGTMNLPKPFVGTDRAAWYTALYAMDGNQSTPLRPALHAVGKMYANLAPYVATSGSEVVQYPCQQNFTFVTTDGYWNGGAATDVVSNDNVENASRFCLRGKGCVDPTVQTGNTLADVALYWYNGGSNTTSTSLRSDLENWSKPGLVPAAAGDNTRLHMNTYALGLGVDGLLTYESGYDKSPVVGGDFYNLVTGVSSGCPWNANGAYVWPDPHTSDTSGTAYQSRVDDLWHTAINGHGKYFSASDPKQVVDGLRAALNNIEVKIGAAAAAATSTPNISQQDNDIFSDTFTTVRWYGELSDKKIDTVTGVVGSTAVWNTSNIVGQKVAASSDTRKIKMLDLSTGGLKDFTYANLAAGLEKGWFDNKCSLMTQCSSLSAADRLTVNSGTNIVNWLRGQQQYANDTILRAYTQTANIPAGLSATIPIVLGDIASSKPAFMREPRKGYTLAGYNDFKVANAARQATVFAAANDGMLHAFNATSGEEMWAYVPRITMSKLAVQASTTYGTNHQFSTDGSPELGDVQIGGVWKTILVAGLNGGGRGYYAVDVTDPANPVALWEICADSTICGGTSYYPNMGLTFGNPQFGTWKDVGGVAHWVVFVSSGYNNAPGAITIPSSPGEGILYVVDVADGHVLTTISNRSGDAGTPSGLAKITAITANPNLDPLVTAVYGGDNQGQMWRFSFAVAGAPTVVKMGDAGTSQPVTTRPEVTMCKVGTGASATAQTVVVFGTGRLLDVPDVSNTDLQSAYVLLDKPTGILPADWRNTSKMARQVLTRLAGTNIDRYTISGTAVDFSTQSGWWVDFNQTAGERVNLDPKVVAGGLNIVTNLPSTSSACAVGGTSNVYQLNVCTGAAINSGSGTNGDGTTGAVGIAGTTLSGTSAAVGFIIIRLPSGALKMVTTTADGNTITSGVAPAITLGSRKTGWRRVKN